MSEQEKFLARFEEKRKAGLIDVKFFVAGEAEMTLERFFAAANHIDDAVAAGKCKVHDEWPKIKQTDISKLLA